MAQTDSNVIINKLYPLVSKALEKNDNKFRKNIGKFITDRNELLFQIAPYDRILFGKSDIDNMYTSLGLSENELIPIMEQVFFWNKPYNPQAAKEPYVMVLMMCIRYYLKNHKDKNAELATIYLAFSGKFYSSIHGMCFPKTAPSKYKSVMDYVVNNMLSDKFDLKREGTVYGAVKSLCCTWISTYKKDLLKSSISDDDIGKLIQQLRDREKSFLKNIAKLYYDAFENRNYLNYETDSLDADSYRLASNDMTKAARITEAAMNYLTSNYVSLDICNKCKDQNVKSTEIKDIIEGIIGDNRNLDSLRNVISILICSFMSATNNTDIKSIEFVAYSIKPKPNTKDKNLIEMKRIITTWLDENSDNYRRRKSRKATQISYIKSVTMYLVLVINRVA